MSRLLRTVSLSKIKPAMRRAPWVPVVILLVFVVAGVFGSFVMPHDPLEIHLSDALTPPFWLEGGTTKYPLGTDALGRDILSRLIGGASVSLEVGFLVIALSALIGSAAALLSGYLGGWVDTVIMRLVDTFLSVPYFIVALVMAAVLTASETNIIIILTVAGWAYIARILRSEVLRIREGDFIELAIVAGASNTRIMLHHIFPNLINTLVTIATLQLGIVIIAESSLSFLGLGIPPPKAAWGSMCAAGRNYMFDAWWVSFWPGVAILLVVLSANLLGDWLRVRLDPKFSQL